MRFHALFALMLFGCDDTLFPGGGGDTDTGALTQDWCGVARVIASDCASCHSADGAAGGLDLETDAHAAIVGVAASTDPTLVLVVPGDPATSFFYRKVTGELVLGEGARMPPGAALSADAEDTVRAWIAAGASADCGDTDIVIEKHHPDGWREPTSHGHAFESHDTANGRTGVDADCRTCHGDRLDGGTSAVSCDGCHEGATADAWRTTCTFCHGGTQIDGGAPPQGILDRAANTLSFQAHTSHVTQPASDTHLPYACTECHQLPSVYDPVFAPGHIFSDTTDARADVRFTAGLSDRGAWNGAGSCSNLYCHGNGQGDNGSYSHTQPTPTCSTCHAAGGSSESAITKMSGEHHKHVWDEGVACATCHAATVAGSTITDVNKHLNGTPDVLFGTGGESVVWNGSTCTGTCHAVYHASEPW